MQNQTTINIDAIVLNHGAHKDSEEGHCLLEVVSMFAGEDFGDSPVCVDPILAAFGRAWNDGMRSDEEREQLKQYITRLPGTAKSAALSQKRGWMAMDWMIRAHTVAWLALTPALAHHAEAIKAQPPITCPADLERVQPLLNAAKKDANAAWAAAWAAAWDAAGAAAWDAAWAAAGAAAWDAAGAAAWAAAGAAAWAAAGAAAWDAAGAAAWDAAWDAAGAAAGDAAGAAARAAAGAKLEPTVLALQQSAHELYSAMIAAGDES